MATEIKITCRMHKEPEFRCMVTSHEGNDDSISIHGSGLDAHIQLSVEQAEDLINKLQIGVVAIETHKKMFGGK
jgi:hypothetical protein